MQPSKTILIVDHDHAMLINIARHIQSIGYGTILATDAAEAISAVRHSNPNLILLNVDFPPDVAHGGGPFSDGFLLLIWLRQMDEAKTVPIVMINGDDSPAHIDRARTAGAAGYFPKPINFDGLMAMIVGKVGEPIPQAQETSPSA